MRLHLSGVTVPRLGSVQDRVIRQFMSKESEKEVKKTNLLALLVVNSGNASTPSDLEKWEEKVKNVFTDYMELELGYKLPETNKKEMEMLDYYTKHVKNLRPTLHAEAGKQGLIVKGLDSIVKGAETERLRKEIQEKENTKNKNKKK